LFDFPFVSIDFLLVMCCIILVIFWVILGVIVLETLIMSRYSSTNRTLVHLADGSQNRDWSQLPSKPTTEASIPHFANQGDTQRCYNNALICCCYCVLKLWLKSTACRYACCTWYIARTKRSQRVLGRTRHKMNLIYDAQNITHIDKACSWNSLTHTLHTRTRTFGMWMCRKQNVTYYNITFDSFAKSTCWTRRRIWWTLT
jgi:hypothetical protein